MPFVLLAMVGGILAVSFLPVLPPLLWLIPGVAAVMALCWLGWRKRLRWTMLLAGVAVGVLWGTIHGHRLVANQLPESLVGKDLWVSGRVVDLPVRDERRQRVILEIDSAWLTDKDGEEISHFPHRIQINWYSADAAEIRSGERWQWQVRLKRPRGFVNPGGFDYQVWLMRWGIGATGYVRENAANQRLEESAYWDIGARRHGLRDWLVSSSDSSYTGILLALLIGDRSMMHPDEWRVMQLTGINHLVSISGLHVGFLAIAGFVLGSQLGRFINLICHACPAFLPGYLFAMLFALVYSALAGFNIPTQRTLIMVLAVQLVCVWRRSYRVGHVFLLALVLVVLNDPLAAYDMGFWLSFGAVAVLLFCFAGRYSPHQGGLSWRWLVELVRSQWVVFIGLLLPLAILINSVSLIAPLANLIAIPLVTFLVVPALLLAATIHGVLPALSQLLLWIADRGLYGLDLWLNSLLVMADHQLMPVISLRGWSLVVAMIAVVVLLLPRGIAGRWLGYPGLLVALILPTKTPLPLAITVLDVGQGLAVVVETPDHRLIYDAGPAYSERFEAGGAIVVPYLRHQGFRGVDKLIISHHDKDHSGGLAGVVKNLPVSEILAGEPLKARTVLPESTQVSDCHTAAPWRWNEVDFYFLRTAERFRSPSSNNTNNRSCVLVIDYAGHRILLPGDIEGRVERQLLADGELPPNLTLVVASHHGSRTSSVSEFVNHTRPVYVVYSAGYRSQHGHPHPQVVERYAARQSMAFNTADSGALTFIWQDDQLPAVREYRLWQRRYWFD